MMKHGLFHLVTEDHPTTPLTLLDTDSTQHQALVVQDDLDDGAKLSASLDEAAQVYSTLQAQQQALQQLHASGQDLSPPEAAVLQTAVEHLCNRLSMHRRKRPAVATESFAQRQGRVQLALEGLGTMIAELFRAIARVIGQAIDWLKNFFKKLFGLEKQEKAQAENLQEQMKKKADEFRENARKHAEDMAAGAPKPHEVPIPDSVMKGIVNIKRNYDPHYIVEEYQRYCDKLGLWQNKFAQHVDAINDRALKFQRSGNTDDLAQLQAVALLDATEFEHAFPGERQAVKPFPGGVVHLYTLALGEESWAYTFPDRNRVNFIGRGYDKEAKDVPVTLNLTVTSYVGAGHIKLPKAVPRPYFDALTQAIDRYAAGDVPQGYEKACDALVDKLDTLKRACEKAANDNHTTPNPETGSVGGWTPNFFMSILGDMIRFVTKTLQHEATYRMLTSRAVFAYLTCLSNSY